MVKKPLPPKPAERRTGRIPGPLEDLRSERLVQRIHPDLMSVILQRSREAGFTRSQYVERILIQYANSVEGAELDAIGKRRPPGQAGAFDTRIDRLRDLRESGGPPPLTYDPPGIGPGLGKANAAYFREEPRAPRPKKK